jgi:Cupin domain
MNPAVAQTQKPIQQRELDVYTSMYLPVNLRKGDFMYFDSNMGHAYIAAGSEPCRILSVCVAPESELVKLMEGKPKPEGDVFESDKKRLNLSKSV